MEPHSINKIAENENCQTLECEICALEKPFDLPLEIVNAYKDGDLVIFAGSGVSTESRGVFPSTFYQSIKNELNLPEDKKISFSKLMSCYCSPPRSRKNLLQAIIKRINYVKTFQELFYSATEFHRMLSTIPHLDEIFTTNWDDFFETECGATPIVTGPDFAILQDVVGRKVYKLHGSIYNYGSIVVTEEDYRKYYKNLSRGIIGSKLKLLLASKTLVFFGFSFDDEDFQRLYRFLNKDVAGLMPQSYVITLDMQAKEKLVSLGINATSIITSATFFVKQLKKKLVEEKLMLPDEQYDGIDTKLIEVQAQHMNLSRLSILKHPNSLYSLWYQDGLMHAFQRLLTTKKTGENSCAVHMIKIIKSYDVLIKRYLHERNYPDVAYFTGYQAGLIYFLSDKTGRKSLSIYFLFGCNDIMSLKQYLKSEKDSSNLHKAAYKTAKALANSIRSEGLTIHRRPFLSTEI
jgi:hypothetical protein